MGRVPGWQAGWVLHRSTVALQYWKNKKKKGDKPVCASASALGTVVNPIPGPMVEVANHGQSQSTWYRKRSMTPFGRRLTAKAVLYIRTRTCSVTI